jgi:mannose-6-phosphate isomerase-like protein (cupin superfamily)
MGIDDMNELEKGINISMSGQLRDKALVEFANHIKFWNLVMPDIEPLVLDFGLDNFYKTGLIECWIANEIQKGYCGKYLFVFGGQTCPMHRHKEKHETFFIIKGKIKMCYDDKSFEMQPGDVLPVDCWKYHSFTGITPSLILEISKPCIFEDNYFENTSIPIGSNYNNSN